MGRPLDEPSKVLGFIPFSDAIFLAAFLFLDGLFFLAISKKLPFLPSIGFTVLIFLTALTAVFLKNIFPKGFFRGMLRFHTNPHLKIPGREKAEF